MATETTAMKELIGLYQPGSRHMVGDGFPVRNLFPSNDLDREVSPFSCWTMRGRSTLNRRITLVAWENILIAGLKRSPLSMKASWLIVIRLGMPE